MSTVRAQRIPEVNVRASREVAKREASAADYNVRASREVVVHRARVPRQHGAINLIVHVHETADETVIDVATAPGDATASGDATVQGDVTAPRDAIATGPGQEDTETTIRPLGELLPPRAEIGAPRPSQNSVTPKLEPLVLAPGGRVGKYELREKLGMGTFGLVFTARDTDLDRDVALKVLNPQHVTNLDVLQRFLHEARASARIQHPGIVTVFDCGRVPSPTGETAFITMELLGGESLTSRLNRAGRLAPELACEIARQVASALDAAHRADVLHRDLKPDNIYLVPDPAVASGERVKVLDFGLAKLGRHGHTMANTVFGTPRYMSPEQCRSSGQIDQRSDVYSLGCILFELVTGRTPFDGDLRQLIERHQRVIPPRARSFAPEISAGLDDLIDAMLAKDPNARPQTMGALQRALQAVGAVSVGVATTMLPMPAQLMELAPQVRLPPTPLPGMPPAARPPTARPPTGHPVAGHPVAARVPGSGPQVFDSEAEILVPARPSVPRRPPGIMFPLEGRRRTKRNVVIASAVAFVIAALLTAIATRAPAIAGTAVTPRAPTTTASPS